ncbi:P-loop containing nucleoside triphosphate hydrolase protein [Mycena rosella]|uniref:P-loop containing nucleoside triphosphate hydrolase protein n=1 Tax=Mycena rosella TaxID=1033263 RepID=A0AAD7DNI1_MYCRO|nr:P-loop containing nucleoside triphosphate hydrolase protein [Mycena rosella]
MDIQTPSVTSTVRSVPMRIIVLGFCRTGTASMRAALSILGYGNTHHIGRVMIDPAEVDAWTAAIDAKFCGKGRMFGREEWDGLLGEFQAVADVPAILFAKELVHAYPDALIILTTRDPDRWWKSFRETLLVMLENKRTRLARWLDPDGYGKFVPFARRNLEILLGPLDVIQEVEAKRRYMAYYDNIQRLAPPGRLLEYEMGEGWERLCEFLGKDTPEAAFPHKNDAMMILKGSRRQMWGIYRRVAMRVLAPAALVVSVFIAMYFRR